MCLDVRLFHCASPRIQSHKDVEILLDLLLEHHEHMVSSFNHLWGSHNLGTTRLNFEKISWPQTPLRLQKLGATPTALGASFQQGDPTPANHSHLYNVFSLEKMTMPIHVLKQLELQATLRWSSFWRIRVTFRRHSDKKHTHPQVHWWLVPGLSICLLVLSIYFHPFHEVHGATLSPSLVDAYCNSIGMLSQPAFSFPRRIRFRNTHEMIWVHITIFNYIPFQRTNITNGTGSHYLPKHSWVSEESFAISSQAASMSCFFS